MLVPSRDFLHHNLIDPLVSRVGPWRVLAGMSVIYKDVGNRLAVRNMRGTYLMCLSVSVLVHEEITRSYTRVSAREISYLDTPAMHSDTAWLKEY